MTRNTRIAAFMGALTAALALSGAAFAQAYDGDWEGALEAGGQKLRLELHLETHDGAIGGMLNSLDQGATIPVSAGKVENGELGLLFLQVGGELKGKLSADGKSIVGAWTQGQTLPLTLTRKAAK
jgi:hypothetical protein